RPEPPGAAWRHWAAGAWACRPASRLDRQPAGRSRFVSEVTRLTLPFCRSLAPGQQRLALRCLGRSLVRLVVRTPFAGDCLGQLGHVLTDPGVLVSEHER